MAISPVLQGDEDLSGLLDLIRGLNDPTDRRVHVGLLRRVVEMAKRFHARFRIDEDRFARDPSLFAQLLLAYNRRERKGSEGEKGVGSHF